MTAYVLKKKVFTDPELACRAAKELGISVKCLYKKMRNPDKWTIAEITLLKRFFSLSMDETIKIFAPKVANRNY